MYSYTCILGCGRVFQGKPNLTSPDGNRNERPRLHIYNDLGDVNTNSAIKGFHVFGTVKFKVRKYQDVFLLKMKEKKMFSRITVNNKAYI